MKNWFTPFVIVVFCLTGMSPAAAQKKSAEPREALEVRTALQSWIKAIESRDRKAMESLTLPDHTYTGTNGRLYSRSENLRSLTSKDFRIESVTTSDVRVRLYNQHTAIVTGKATSKEAAGDQTSIRRSAFTQTWIKSGGGAWQLAAEQSTSLPGKAAKPRKKRR